MSAFVNPAHDAATPMRTDESPALPAEQSRESAGTQLTRWRRQRSLEVADVAGRLKFGRRQIEALESDDYARLPGATFVRGMIRSYAKLLECDPQPMLLAFDDRHVSAPASDPTPLSVPFPDGRVPSTRIYLALCLVLILVVGSVVYEWEFGLPSMLQPGAPVSAEQPVSTLDVTQGDSTTPAAAPAERPIAPEVPVQPRPVSAPVASTSLIDAATPEPQPVAKPPDPVMIATPAMATGERLLLEFERESWVEVRDRNGKILALGLNPPGNSRLVEGRAPYALVIGNASHVRLTYKGSPFDLKPFIRDDVARFSLN